MTDWLSGGFNEDQNTGGGDDFGGSYLDLDSPPAPDAAPMPPAPPADSGSYLGGDAGGFGGAAMATADPYAPAAPAAADPFGQPHDASLRQPGETMPSYFQEAPAPMPQQVAMHAAPAGAMGGLTVDAPYLEEVHPGQHVHGGRSKGEISDLVLDVEVQVEVCFGDAALTVEEFLEMGRGSVVELDHAIDAPIELKVKGRLVARGQLVSINGNYGMRITEMTGEGNH